MSASKGLGLVRPPERIRQLRESIDPWQSRQFRGPWQSRELRGPLRSSLRGLSLNPRHGHYGNGYAGGYSGGPELAVTKVIFINEN